MGFTIVPPLLYHYITKPPICQALFLLGVGGRLGDYLDILPQSFQKFNWQIVQITGKIFVDFAY